MKSALSPPHVSDSPRRVRLLHLEDDPTDQELVRRDLAAAGLDCDFIYVVGRADYEAALQGHCFDLILSDFTLPGYDGNVALALARAQCPETPFLFVSGTIGEERAIESLKSGATDYVLKNRLERLAPAVRRALREAREQTNCRASEIALRESEERFREMAETIRAVFWVASPDGRHWRYVSPAYQEIFGREPVDPMAGSDAVERIGAILPEHRPAVQLALDGLMQGLPYRLEYQIARPDGSSRWVEDRGYPVRGGPGQGAHAVGVIADITDRRQLEAQLLQAQKMEAIGQLAGGIAHDFNNILTVINGGASRLLDAGHLAPSDAHSLRQIYTAGERAASLTRQLLVFSRKQTMRREPLALNALIEEVAVLLGRLIGEDIRLRLDLAPNLPAIKADSVMLEQVLMNLAVNARDAMPQGGQLTIATRPAAFTADDLAGHASRRVGDFVRLSVEDTGAGIPPGILSRIFEPFFTTKREGAGTGLGLATAFGIVEHHDGWFEVTSAVGQGARFEVFLPPTMEPVPPPTKSEHPFSPAVGRPALLIVEDESAVREFAVAVLEHAGYRVLQAASGAQALEVWKWHGSRIKLLLTDLVMPDGLSGVQLAETLRAQKPDLKIVLTSGYSREMSGSIFALQNDYPFLQKPYIPATLLRFIGSALASLPPSAA